MIERFSPDLRLPARAAAAIRGADAWVEKRRGDADALLDAAHKEADTIRREAEADARRIVDAAEGGAKEITERAEARIHEIERRSQEEAAADLAAAVDCIEADLARILDDALGRAIGATDRKELVVASVDAALAEHPIAGISRLRTAPGNGAVLRDALKARGIEAGELAVVEEDPDLADEESAADLSSGSLEIDPSSRLASLRETLARSAGDPSDDRS